MVTYFVVNIAVLVVVVAMLRFVGKRVTWNRSSVATLLILLLATALFDSIIVANDIVDYDPNLLLGLYIGFAPVEDFFYTIVAVVLIPSLWHIFHKDENAKQ